MATKFPFQFPVVFGKSQDVPEWAVPGNVYSTGVSGIRFPEYMGGVYGLKTGNEFTKCPDIGENPMAALQYMRNKQDAIIAAAQQRPMVRLGDKDLEIVAELTGEMVCDYEELAADSGQARYVVRYDNWIVDYIINRTRIDEDLHLLIDPIPTERDWRTRWGGKIHTINVKRNDDGTSTVELLAISHRQHAKKLLYAANPFFAPELQIPKMWILPGPIRTVLFMSGFVNLARLFVPGLSFITNAFNPAAWLNPLNASGFGNLDPLNWPIQMAFVNPALDTSRWTVLGATWTDWHSATADLLADCGSIMRFYTYLTEDADSPHEELHELAALLPDSFEEALDKLIKPRRNCVVARVEDWSGHEGPTGTPLDGLLDTIGVSLDDLFTSIFIDGNNPTETLDGSQLFDVDNPNPLFQKLLGVRASPPKVVWRDEQFSAIIQSQHTLHKGTTKTVMTGGRSPALVNETQTFLIKYGLAQLSTMLNVAIGTFVNTAFEMPGTPGLDALYQGQLDNIAFAWERITDPIRAIHAGDLAYQEHFERGSGTAYTLAGWLTLREARHKTRAYNSFRATVRNGFPWILDKDCRLGQRSGWEFDQIIYVDQLRAIKRGWDRKKPVLGVVSVGDDQDEDDVFARGMRVLQAVYSLLGAFMGEGTVFG